MSQLDDFLDSVLARQAEARLALSNGDAEPWLAMTSRKDPVTIFGAKVPVRQGSKEVDGTLRWLAARWSDVTVSTFDLVAADVSGDLAYVIGFERIANSVAGEPVEPYTLRVTHVYRRENGAWKMAHRHADRVPEDPNEVAGIVAEAAVRPAAESCHRRRRQARRSCARPLHRAAPPVRDGGAALLYVRPLVPRRGRRLWAPLCPRPKN